MDTSTLLNSIGENFAAEKMHPANGMNYASEDRIQFMEGLIQRLAKKQSTDKEVLGTEKEINKKISNVVSIASHEFRSSLSNIQLSASVIERYYDRLNRKKIMDHISTIQSAVLDMSRTINNLLILGDQTSVNAKSAFAEFDLQLLATEITEEIQVMLGRQQQLSYQHNGGSTKCRLDIHLLRHCIVNIISNAIKYSGEEGQIDFTTEITSNKCLISIRDNGIGIPKKDQPQLYNAFYRASNTANIPGTGLGLHIVDRYVKQMNGAIRLQSRIHAGTFFQLIFPV